MFAGQAVGRGTRQEKTGVVLSLFSPPARAGACAGTSSALGCAAALHGAPCEPMVVETRPRTCRSSRSTEVPSPSTPALGTRRARPSFAGGAAKRWDPMPVADLMVSSDELRRHALVPAPAHVPWTGTVDAKKGALSHNGCPSAPRVLDRTPGAAERAPRRDRPGLDGAHGD